MEQALSEAEWVAPPSMCYVTQNFPYSKGANAQCVFDVNWGTDGGAYRLHTDATVMSSGAKRSRDIWLLVRLATRMKPDFSVAVRPADLQSK